MEMEEDRVVSESDGNGDELVRHGWRDGDGT